LAFRKKAQRRKQGQHCGQPNDLKSFFQFNHLNSRDRPAIVL
jgi:hypothetical protein